MRPDKYERTRWPAWRSAPEDRLGLRGVLAPLRRDGFWTGRRVERAGNANAVARFDPVRRALDHAVVGAETRCDLDLLAQVARDRDRLAADAIIAAYGRDIHAVLIEHQ